MPLLTIGIAARDVFDDVATTPEHGIGQLGRTKDGRLFRYVENGGVALVVGNAIQAPAQDTDHDQLTCRVTAAGATALLMTTGAGGGALDANEYAEGFAIIDTTPGLGYCYRISDHAAIAASTDGTINLVPEDAIEVALTAASRVTLVQNPYKNVVQHPVTTATNVCVGGAVYPIALDRFGWIQSGGVGAALIAGTPAVGQPVTSVSSVAGSLAVHSAELNHAADMLVTGVDAKVLPVFWRLET